MANENIKNLDYFDLALLYHNSYLETKYSQLPAELKQFRTEDRGLKVIKGVIAGQNIKEPYTIVNLIKVLRPEKPRTHQQIYGRALFLADLCDTTVSKIIKSNMFNAVDFIPNLKSNVADEIIKNKGTGPVKELTSDEYTPWPDPGPGPQPTPGTGDYADEEKIYFFVEGNNYRCNKTFEEVTHKLPKLPAAELVFDGTGDYKNILDISSGYDSLNQVAKFNFILMYDNNMEMFTISYSEQGIELEHNSLVVGNETI